MNSTSMSIAKHMASNSVSNMKNAVGDSLRANPNPQIDWNDFNYPPVLRLFHYNIEELQGAQKAIVSKMHLSYVIFLLSCVVNLASSLVMITDHGAIVRICYSVLNFIIIMPIVLYSFYKGYRGITFDASNLRLFKITQVILICLFLVCSIAHLGSFNGWMSVSVYLSAGWIIHAVLAGIESFLFTINVLLMAFTLYVVNNYSAKGPSDSGQVTEA